MQDRFKFRLYDKAIGEMVYDVCVGFIKDYGKTDDWVCADTSCGQITYLENKIKDIVLMQCTGLKDKNGKLIYEGDIVQTTFENNLKIIFSVVWDDKTALFNGKIIKKEGINNYFMPNRDYLYYLLGDKEDEVEVIGNIYENPELLKDGE
jgi:uncharacterized phage protein (TIGR01671 family)